MREGEPSRTAYGAARLRALHQVLDHGRVFRDPLAARILGEDPDETESRARLRVFIAARHRFAEDALADAVERGTRQVVVLGAGLDTFAYRNPHAGTHVFEVDFPATGEWKRARLVDAGIDVPTNVTFVGVDFETDDLLTRLTESGFDAAAPAYFLWLGVVPYLTPQAVTATLRAIASVPGGEVVFDYSHPLTGPTDGDRVALRERVAAAGEPFTGGWETAALHHLLRDLGFGEIEDISRREIRSRYLGLPAGDSDGPTHVVRARRLTSP